MRNEIEILGPIPDLTEQSKSDIKYSIELIRWFLTPIGIWPTSSSTCEKILSEILVIVSFCLICFLLIPCSLHTFLNEKDPRMKMKMIGPLSFCLMAISKYCFLVMRKEKIRECLKHIQTDWRRVQLSTERDVMLTNAKEGRFIANLSATFMYGGGFFYHTIMPLTAGSFVTPDNITIRPLTYQVYDPLFAAQKTPSYEIVFTIQWFSGFVLYSITIGTCSLAAVFVLHACGQLKIVMSRLENLIDGTNEKMTDILESRIAQIVQLHLRAFNFIVRTEKILNEVCLIEFIGCTMNICFLGYYFMTEFERAETIATVTYCVLLVSFTFNIFILCYIGEMLTQQGLKVGLTAYMINWYELSGRKARDLILLLAIANYPNSITAGRMAELSYNSFCGILKSAAAYLNLLRTVVM
ncbi:GSCOCT00013798001.3-RA-CDS [Cotesia congregata]|uniref:Odorant receptor n=1 Tax=Cotesia congregata TaxID=51543 RepID=A0A8J2HJM0_COTCN|nr:GSCOCT00013798001.3-RA-CDS [Cotesia congregata]CAG5100933.1 olfactory receptor 11 [Cotesia congregata]